MASRAAGHAAVLNRLLAGRSYRSSRAEHCNHQEQARDDKSARGQMFNGLDELVESTVRLFSAVFNVKLFSAVFNVKSFTKSWLTTGFWIAYVYLDRS